MPRKLKVIHIHSDYKFVNASGIFDGENFDNTTVILESKEPYKDPLKNDTLIFSQPLDKRNFSQLVNVCKNAHLVVLYCLDSTKARLALALPETVKIAWRFFGYELYDKRKDLFVGPKSRTASITNLPKRCKIPGHSILRSLYNKVKYGGTPESLFYQAIERIDYMLVLSEEEYTTLSHYWENLPEFIQLPRGKPGNLAFPDLDLKKRNVPRIILGHSRSSFNNHLELLDIVKENSNDSRYNFVLFFSYGNKGNYAQAVRQAVAKRSDFTLIEKFMPRNEFIDFYKSVSALVINSYRQLAGSNIMFALRHGVKIYLNQKNAHLTWLRNEGFKIFTIEDFANDLKSDNIQPDYEMARHNFQQLLKLYKKYPPEKFQKEIYNKINSI